MTTVKTVAITNGKSKPAKGFWTTETPFPVANGTTAKAPRATAPKAERTAKAEAAPRTATCLCGCGGMPTGKTARFLPGHDGRLKGRLIAEAKRGSAEAVAQMTALGWSRFLPAQA